MEEITIWHIIFGALFVWVLYFFFKTIKTISSNDFWKSWTSKLDEKNENRNISNSSTHLSSNPLFWWLTWYTIANLFNDKKDKEKNEENTWNEENINNEENNWNENEQSLDNGNTGFEQNFDDFDSSFDSSFDDWWFDWWSD